MNVHDTSIDRLVEAARLAADPSLVVVERRQPDRRPVAVQLYVGGREQRLRCASFATRLRSETGSAGADLLSVIVGLTLVFGFFVGYPPIKREILNRSSQVNLSVCPNGPREGQSAVSPVVRSPSSC